jgi:hypothetical protein
MKVFTSSETSALLSVTSPHPMKDRVYGLYTAIRFINNGCCNFKVFVITGGYGNG